MSKYLFSDLDGTLMLEKDNTIPSTKIPTHNLEKIKEFTNKGNFFAIATGRPLANVKKLIAENQIADLCVCENGMIVSQDNKIVIEGQLNQEELKELLDYLKTNNLEFLGFYADEPVAFFNDNVILESTQVRMKKYSKMYNFIKTSEIDISKIIHLTILFTNSDSKQSHVDNLNLKLKHTKVIPTMHDAADFVNKTTSKLNAIKKFCEINNISHDEVGYVGDGFNDLECLNYFKNSFVMKNSTKELLSNLKNKDSILVEDVAEAIKIFIGE